MKITSLGDPVTFYQRHFKRKWWTSTIQSYAQMKLALKGEGLHQHHLIPKALFLDGPQRTRALVDYIPSITFSAEEHLATLHPVLNSFLKGNGLWQKRLSLSELDRAIVSIAQFYEGYGLSHFAEAVRGFHRKAFKRVK